ARLSGARRAGDDEELRYGLPLRELGEESVLLLGPQPTDPTAGRDVEALHDLARPDLPHTRERLQHGGHLHLADDLVALMIQDVAQGHLLSLQLLLELGAALARFGRLGQSLLALFFCQGR